MTWCEYGVRVKGYSLDAEVKFIRLLGVSPETGEEEIKKTFMEVGIGEVIEIKKGWLDARRLPGVTNGTWALRVKILDQDRVIPSYIHSLLRVGFSAAGSAGAAITLETSVEIKLGHLKRYSTAV